MLWVAVLLAGVVGGHALLAVDSASAAPGSASARPTPERTDHGTQDSTDAYALLPLGGGVVAFGAASVLVLRRLDFSDAE